MFHSKARYYLPDRSDVFIPQLRFRIPVENGLTSKTVDCLARGPFIADFVWEPDSDGYYCDRLFLAKDRVRLDDVPALKHLVAAAEQWAEENDIGRGEWECD